MRYIARRPPPALAPFVTWLWWYDGDGGDRRERILPAGRGQLLVNLAEPEMRTYDPDGVRVVERCAGAAFVAASQGPVGIDTMEQKCIVGVAFEPGGAWPFLRAPVDALDRAYGELDVLWGRSGAVVRERLLEASTPAKALDVLAAILLEQIARPLSRDRSVAYALAAFERGASVGQVVDDTGLTQRTFLRRFSERVGMAPKRYACIRRFQRVLDTADRGGELDWARIAAECGYYDQPHLIHEFRTFAGMAPTEYAPAAPGMRNHVAL
jgi:AraC-like DNA-binding protein